jgi:HEAT repeat protein
MRLRIILPVVALAIVIAAMGWGLRPHLMRASPAGVSQEGSTSEEVLTGSGSSDGSAASAAPATQTSPPASEPAPPDSPATHEQYVKKRTAELENLAMENDRSSLDTILSELDNRDPEIRKSALQATIQFGSREAIPRLSQAASQTESAEEKTALLDAVEFLKLPSLTEVLAEKRAQAGQRK